MRQTDSSPENLDTGPDENSGENLKRPELTFIVLMFIAAVLIRLLVVSSQPLFAGTANAGSWAALAREIRANGFLIPAMNAIHYPGSEWVYPPVVPYMLALLSLVVRQNGMNMMYAVSALEIAIQSLTLIPVYMAVRKLFGIPPAVIAASIFIAYPPMLYLITWSALPQIVALFVISLVIWLLASVQKAEKAGFRSYSAMVILSFLLIFIHDLSAFVFVLCIVISILYFSIAGRRSGIRYRPLVQVLATGLVASVSGILLWYLPRIQWLAQFSSISTGSVPGSFLQILRVDLLNLAQPLAVPGFIHTLSFIFIPLVALLIFGNYVLRGERKVSAVLIFSTVLFVILVLAMPFTTVFIRLSYFLLFFYVYIASLIVYRLMFPSQIGGEKLHLPEKVRNGAKLFRIFVVVFIILYSAWGVSYEYNAHTYYLSNGSQGPHELTSAAEWISLNVNSTAVIAASGYTGFLIMGYTGNPVINYVNRTMLTQTLEVRESNAAGILVNSPLQNVSATLDLISEYSVSVIVTNLSSMQVPEFYSLSYVNGGIFVYRV